MARSRARRSGKQKLEQATRAAVDRLGFADYEVQGRARRIFDELYSERFSGCVDFLGVRHGIVYLRVRDGTWVRRVKAFERQLLADLEVLGGDGAETAKRLRLEVGPAPAPRR
jgi:hypothetical protein